MKISLWLQVVALAFVLATGRGLAGETATAVATVTAGYITAITVKSGGSGYTIAPAVTLSGGGGSGATARALLSGDKVGLIIVLNAGSGYTGVPTVGIEAPPSALGVTLEMVPKLTVQGPAGGAARVEWAASLGGPWTTWSNVAVGPQGTVLVDLAPGATRRFYRAVEDPMPVWPAGFVWISPGTFMMGSPTNEPNRVSNELQHTVTLTKGFWLSDHETTQAEYQAVMGTNPSFFKGMDRPVVSAGGQNQPGMGE